jgi:glucokinase
MSLWLGVDIGGTRIKLGLVTGEGELLARAASPFDRGATFEQMADSVLEAASRLAADRTLSAVGIAAPGYAHPSTGILIDGANNVPALRGQSLPAVFAARLGVPAFIENDGTCATTGEMLFGAGRPFRRFALITIGTGIGGGVVVDRRVVTGPAGLPPEIGALCLDPRGPANYSGIAGTLERLASAEAFLERYRQGGGRREAAAAIDVFRLAGEGDRAAGVAIDGVARVIAQAFGIMVNLLNLEACLIGGGVSAAGAPLQEAVARHLPAFTWPALGRNTRVLLAAHGNDAGILGAAAIAGQRVELGGRPSIG